MCFLTCVFYLYCHPMKHLPLTATPVRPRPSQRLRRADTAGGHRHGLDTNPLCNVVCRLLLFVVAVILVKRAAVC